MRHFLLTAFIVLSAFNGAIAAPSKGKEASPEIFTVNKRDYNDRMYLYLYCLANTEFRNDVNKVTERCSPVLNKSNAFNNHGLENTISADIKSLNADLKDMLNCLSKEANSTSNLSDSSAVSFCEVMVNPTSGIQL